MNILEMYKKLSKEDKANLTIYSIYNEIFDVSANENINIDDEIAKDIQELAYNLYLDDEFRNLSAPQIAYFLAECYAQNNNFVNIANDLDYEDILQAVEDDNYDFYKEEMER